jgi:hypothetical protein
VAARLGGDDRDLLGPDVEMAQQEGQDALADAAEADDDKPSGKGDVLVVGHAAP